jgi:hypothetical protein
MHPKEQNRKNADLLADQKPFPTRAKRQTTLMELSPAAPEHETTFDLFLDAGDQEPERWDGLS